MSKKNIKILIIVGIVAIIYIGIFFLLHANLFERRELYLILDNDNNYAYKKGEFIEITDDKIEKANKFYNIYIDGENMGKYRLSKGNAWNLFDEKDNYNYIEHYFVGVAGDYPIEFDLLISRNLDKSEKEMLKKDYGVKINEDLITGKVYETHLDDNDILDKIIVSSYNEVGENTKNFYNLVIIIIDGEKTALINQKKEEANNFYEIRSIFRLKDEKYKSFVLETIENPEGDINTYKKYSSIYQFNKKGYQKI